MEYTVPIEIESLGRGEGYAATSESFPGFLAHGRTFEETITRAETVLKSMLEAYRDKGIEPPIKAKKVAKVRIEMPLPVSVGELVPA
jgi:predicted RNase H-like HicB family nuclease